MADFFASLQSLAHAYGAWGVFALSFIQEIFPPINSTLVTLSSGALFLAGQEISASAFSELFFVIALPVAAGMTVGSAVIYGLAYAYGKIFIDRWGRYLGVSWTEVERLQKYLRGHIVDDIVFFAARALPVMPSVLLGLFAGAVRWRPASFILLTFFGTLLRAFITGFIGWQAGGVFTAYYAQTSGRIEALIGVAALLALALYVWKKKV